ncbi:aminodeoxychorismate lyase [Luteococcus peritonei]|uniref:Aminodeoxychorismate lyase n=1 Tax=Luteococcus peritonei TaxID=88874 RepID=A0ABW4S0S9_9ACTN
MVASADDLGFTRGDGCFDATRVVTGRDGVSTIDNLDAHLARLNRSVVGLGDEPTDLAVWQELVAEAVDAWSQPGEATLKLMYSRGPESNPGRPLLVLTITEMSEAALAQRQGVRVAGLDLGRASDAFTDRPWLLGGVKSLSYAVNMAAKREAARRGADDVLFLSSDGFCLEGPTAALVVAFGRELVTTPVEGTGILDSITQKQVFATAEKKGWTTSYRLLRPAQLADADGVWLVSSVRGAAPVLELDGVALPQDAKLSAKVMTWAGF